MFDKPSSRRNFLQVLGLTAGATLLTTNALGNFVDHTEILKLTPEQQEFMLRYEIWMDDFIDVIRIQKKDPDNVQNNNNMLLLTDRAEEFKPELAQFMQDEKFSIIYRTSIERMSKEI